MFAELKRKDLVCIQQTETDNDTNRKNQQQPLLKSKQLRRHSRLRSWYRRS